MPKSKPPEREPNARKRASPKPHSGKTLAVAIPAYCGSDLLRSNLAGMVREAESLGITIYVSDDSPDDESKRVVEGFAAQGSNIEYRKNVPSLRHDRNLFDTLTWPREDFVWLLGQGISIKPGFLTTIAKLLADQDFIFVNSHSNRNDDVMEARGEAALRLTRDLLWHQTLTGTTIYNQRVTSWARETRPPIYSNFPQLSVLLGYLESRPATISWLGERILTSEQRESYWRAAPFDCFVDDWAKLVTAFPHVVPATERRRVLKSHSLRTELFDPDYLQELKDNGHFNWASLRRPSFFDVMHISRAKVLSLLLLPRPAWKLLANARRRARALVSTRQRTP